MAKSKTIRLNDLLVNTENYRFETVASQREAIDLMLDDQGDYLYNLAEDLLTDGLNPNDRIQVVPSEHEKSKYIVLEGNRRTVTLKILNNPDLIEGSKHASLKRRIKKLKELFKDTQLTSIECTVYDDPKEADKWIGIKHGYGKVGVATNEWNPLQKQRFAEKTEGKTSRTIQIINLLKESDDVPATIKSNVSKISTTNLDRLIDDPNVRDFLGIEINNGSIQSKIDKKEVVKALTQIVKDILDPKFTVKKIYDKDARKDYINKFPKTSVPNKDNKATKPWNFTSTKNPVPVGTSTPTSKQKANPKDRSKLIPKSCVIKISNPKVNSIYYELQTLDVTKFANSAAVTFRVFVELSIDSYIDHHKIGGITGSSAKSGKNLQQKINEVANHLEAKKFADATICKGIKSAIKDSNDILGIDTWHAYVHNNKFRPKPDSLIITWDNMQEFMVILWNNTN